MRVRCLLMAVAAASLAAGCGLEPGAPLIALPEKPATVLPSDVPPVRAEDGFPVILADPATVAGLPRPPEEVAAAQARLEARGRATEAEAARVAGGPSNVAALAARGQTHVDEARRRIEASGRPQLGAAPRELPAMAAAPRVSGVSAAPVSVEAAALSPGGPAVDPVAASPVDHAAPAPRAVGGSPLLPATAD